MTKEQIISKIAELKYPKQVIKQSLEVRRTERCGYTKVELLNELMSMPEYISTQRSQKLSLLGI